MKSTPKSCSCNTCRSLYGRPLQQTLRKLEERTFRHSQKQALSQGRDLNVVSAGTRMRAA